MAYYKLDEQIIKTDIAPELPTGKAKYFTEVDGKKTELITDEAVDNAVNVLGLEVSKEQATKPAPEATKAEYDKYVQSLLNPKPSNPLK